MLEVRTTDEFKEWFDGLDETVQARIGARLDKLARGLWGDRKDFGAVIELREHFGAGYRIYAVERGRQVVIVLAGGSKKSQAKDIARAAKLAAKL